VGNCRQSGVTHGAFCLLPEREYYPDYRLGSSHACAAPRSGAAGAVGDARLVSSTHNPPSLPIDIHPDRPPGPVYRVVVHDFGGGYIEGVIVRESRRLSAPSSSRRRSSRTRDEMSPEDLRRSVSRARKSMRHKVLMMGADRMLTLTYRANQCDLSLAYSHLSAFCPLSSVFVVASGAALILLLSLSFRLVVLCIFISLLTAFIPFGLCAVFGSLLLVTWVVMSI